MLIIIHFIVPQNNKKQVLKVIYKVRNSLRLFVWTCMYSSKSGRSAFRKDYIRNINKN